MNDETRADQTLADDTIPAPPPPPPAPSADSGEARGGAHPVNIGHLVMGLVFLTFVGAWALIQTDVVTGDDVHWLLPLPWVVGGAVGLLVAVLGGVRRRR